MGITTANKSSTKLPSLAFVLNIFIIMAILASFRKVDSGLVTPAEERAQLGQTGRPIGS